MGFNQAPALPYRNLGIVEDGDTASQAIEKDKYVIWKGQNYFTKTDILQGETFVVDTNLTAMPEGVINGIVDTLSASSPRIFIDEKNLIYSLINAMLNYTATEDCFVIILGYINNTISINGVSVYTGKADGGWWVFNCYIKKGTRISGWVDGMARFYGLK